MPTVSVDLSSAAQELDLERRIREVPETALIRGIFFRQVEHDLRSRGLSVHPSWSGSTVAHPSLHGLYPLRDYMKLVATAAALIGPTPRDGARRLYHGLTTYSTKTWYGRVLLRYLRPEPDGALRWLERSRDFLVNYGWWRVEQRAPTKVVLHMFDEYLWIDSLHVGGCEGLLIACGAEGSVRAELDKPYQGRLYIEWFLRN